MRRDQTPIESSDHQAPDMKESQVVFPAEPERVIEFISGLLGKPQSLERTYSGQFAISYDDVINTHELIEQRIHQQNEASLVQFVVSIRYHDNSSVRLNSLQDFKEYSEVKPLFCLGATLSWTYLVKFQQKSTPEKQQIDLSFHAAMAEEEHVIQYNPSEMRFIDISPSRISLRINYTERTWGNDLDSLLDGHIRTIVQEPKGIKSWISRHNGNIGLAVGVLIFAGANAGSGLAVLDFAEANLQALRDTMSSYTDGIQAINQKVDYITNLVATGIWPKFVLSIVGFYLLSIILSIFLGAWVASKADNKPPSFVLLSQESIRKKEKFEKRVKRDWNMFFLSIIVSLTIGVVSNILFHRYFSTL